MKLSLKTRFPLLFVFVSMLAAGAFAVSANGARMIQLEYEGIQYVCIFSGNDRVVHCHALRPGLRNHPIPEALPIKARCQIDPSSCA